jgi:LysM repeat protein
MAVGQSPARLAAIAALAVGLVALVIVFSASLGGDDGGGSRNTGQAQPRQNRTARIYVVKPGDTLTTIAAKTGVGVEELQRLNPNIDPQVMRSGQRVRLR